MYFRAREEIRCALWRERRAASCKAPRRRRCRVHRRGAATQQMAARRRAPSGCGPQARWLCCSLGEYHCGYAPRSRRASGPGGQQQSVHLISLRALSTSVRRRRPSATARGQFSSRWNRIVRGHRLQEKFVELDYLERSIGRTGEHFSSAGDQCQGYLATTASGLQV